MKPSIGRVVHFWENEKENAAMVVRVHSDTCVDLHVYKQAGGEEHATSIELGGKDKNRTWSWPEKVG